MTSMPGRPDELFFLPERSDGENHLQYTTQQQLEEVRNSADLGPTDNDNDYEQYYQYVCEQEQIAQPKTWKEALTLTLFQRLLTLESYNRQKTMQNFNNNTGFIKSLFIWAWPARFAGTARLAGRLGIFQIFCKIYHWVYISCQSGLLPKISVVVGEILVAETGRFSI